MMLGRRRRLNRLSIVLLLAILATVAVCTVAVRYYGSAARITGRSGPEQSQANVWNRRPGFPDQEPAGRFPPPNQSLGPGLAAKPVIAPATGRQAMPPGARPTGSAAGASIRRVQSLIIAYAVVFFGLSMLIYWLLAHKKVKPGSGDEALLIAGLLCIALLLRISAATLMEGHPFDIGLFKAWATAAAGNLTGFYSGNGSCDYPPLYIYVLFVVGRLASLPSLSPYFTLLLKLPSMAADIATSYLIYRLSRIYLSPRIGLMLSAFYAFNPAVIINSTFWGQVDSFFTLLVVAALLMMAENRTGPAAALFAAAVMMKPQGIIFLPVVAFEMLRQKSCRPLLRAVAIASGTAAAIALPFSLRSGVLWIFRLFAHTLSEYPYASVNAYNLFGLLGANYRSDAATLFLFSYHTWGLLLIVLITALAWFFYARGNGGAFAPAAALLLIAGVFIFGARMHERYLFPAVALAILAFIYLRDYRLLLLALGFSATGYLNTHTILFGTLEGMNAAPYGAALIVASVLNLLLFGSLAAILFKITVAKRTVSVKVLPENC